MKSAAPRPRPRTSADAFPARLLAVRKAAAPFHSVFSLRCTAFESLLAERDACRAELSELRPRLLDALHGAVPDAPGRAARRRLLDCKRDVFNGRPTRLPPADETGPALAADLARHDALARRLDALAPHASACVEAEARAALNALLAHPRFRLACRYSSPGLWEALERGSESGGAGIEALGRGLYAYAARFIAKANPFHVFAEVAFPPALGIVPNAEHEVVLDWAVVAAMEDEALAQAADPHRVRIAPLVFTVQEGRYRFWTPTPRGLRVAALPAGPALDAMAAFFRGRQRATGSPTGTRAECEAFLRARLGEAAGDPGPLLDALAANGLVRRYLVTGAAPLDAELRGFSEAVDTRLDALAPLHLAQVDTATLASAEAPLAAAAGPHGAGYHVNSYARADTAEHERAAAAVAADLRALKPFFSADPNFAAHSAAIGAFVAAWLREHGVERAPYPALLAAFLRERDTLLARSADAGPPPEWRAALAAESGELRPERLAELLPRPAPEERALCFNGPFCRREGVFHVTNAWAGQGRFIARYLLGRAPRPELRSTRRCLHVELAVPPRTELERVVPALEVGCGFDARLSHAFRRWLSPADVLVEAPGGEVAYRHAQTGRRLAFHYRGFLLAEHLPPEYQLMLAGHADTFSNPFDAVDGPGIDAVRRFEGLRHGRVCLRRERWAVPARLLRAESGDWVGAAAEARDRVREATGSDEELWYYRTSDRADGRKPRFLDLRNPLGLTAFRRALAALPEDGTVSLSPMRPGPDGLWRFNGEPYVTELMVEA
jgi:hypothetical protein